MSKYEAVCGKECPQFEPCPHMDAAGFCTLKEPWFDCDDFMYEHEDTLDRLEREETEREERESEEEEEREDDW